MGRKPGLFNRDERYRKLSEVGDPLTRLKELIDCDVFRSALASVLKRSNGLKGGRPPYDAVLKPMIDSVIFKDLSTYPDERGFFREVIRRTDPFFAEGFGQISHSLVNPGVAKA